mgnify:CR=1 FL=1
MKTYNVAGTGYNFLFVGREGYMAAVYNSKRSKKAVNVIAYAFDDTNNLYDVWVDGTIATTESIELTVVWINM